MITAIILPLTSLFLTFEFFTQATIQKKDKYNFIHMVFK